MKRLSMLLLAVALTGCARPGEIGWTTVLTADERGKEILRNWDWEGKQLMDDIDHALLLRPMNHLSMYHLR